jgi:hypothetical protein
MNFLRLAGGILVAAMLAMVPLRAQVDSKPSSTQPKAASAAHESDFDYLLGDWEFTSESKEHGKFQGRWSAVRLETGQILDEYRVLGSNGETYYVTSTIRAYNAMVDRWELIGMDGGGGLQDFGTERLVNGEMNIEQKFGVAEGKPTVLRIRYYHIQPDRFSWSADRSLDGGVTWISAFQRIEARRIGLSRSLGALALPRSHRQRRDCPRSFTVVTLPAVARD